MFTCLSSECEYGQAPNQGLQLGEEEKKKKAWNHLNQEEVSASDQEKREGLVSYYLHLLTNASWEHLGGKLLW